MRLMNFCVVFMVILSGGFVSMPDLYGVTAQLVGSITSPASVKVYTEVGTEGTFNINPYETGNYKICLQISPGQHGLSRYVVTRDVMLDVHLTAPHEDHAKDKAKDDDTHGAWSHINQIQSELNQLRSTQQYLSWREKRHRDVRTSAP
jgi:hypothetical protein